MRLILVRHATTLWNREGKIQGQKDIELDDGGKEEASELVEKLKILPIEKIISSDLKRARQTADIIGHGLQIGVTSDVRLRECSFGGLEGLTKTGALEKCGKDILSDWEDDYRAYDFSRFGGEKQMEVLARHKDLINEVFAKNSHATVLFVGHGRGLNTLISYLSDAPDLKRGEYRVYEIEKSLTD